MNRRRFRKWLGLLILLFLVLFPTLPIVAAQGPAVTDKVEPALLEQLAAGGEADFLLIFGEQADLFPAYQMGWHERGEFVVRTLNQVARRSQAAAKAYLDRQGLRYETFIAGNELYVWSGDVTRLASLASFPEVAYIRGTRVYEVGPIQPTDGPAPQGTTSWGIVDTGADDFWAAYSMRGEGMVVANIDTGVQWNHPALVNQFRCPGQPADPACWRDPKNVCKGSACDNNGHGTHTMGTMVGSDDPGLPYNVGMAPKSQWIACKGCESRTCSEYSLNACADWILAPGGSAANRPHVVNNSWGGDRGCDTWYLGKVSAWRAAGIFPAFAAGNLYQYYGCNSLSAPGNYQESFASAAHNSGRYVASFSSRGWQTGGSGSCDPHDPYTKPNISAPGVSVISAFPPNGWASGSGTSMASPHSAGAVALLWSCNPGLVGQVDQTFQLLQEGADAPPAGGCDAPPDAQGNYTYGYGYLNVLRAGQTVCQGGFLSGHVYQAGSGTPLPGAIIDALPSRPLLANTDATGYYTHSLAPGTYDVTASRGAYLPESVTDVVIVTDTVTTQDFYLDPVSTMPYQFYLPLAPCRYP